MSGRRSLKKFKMHYAKEKEAWSKKTLSLQTQIKALEDEREAVSKQARDAEYSKRLEAQLEAAKAKKVCCVEFSGVCRLLVDD